MEATVNDVLDFRKLDANMFSMSRKPVVVRDLIDSVCRHCRPFLKAHVQFGYRVSPADAVAMIDHRRMFQIIINGLSNAGKFTHDGVVAVDVSLQQLSAHEAASMAPTVVTAPNAGSDTAATRSGSAVGSSNSTTTSGGGVGGGVGDGAALSVSPGQYIVVTVSNSSSSALDDPESLFVPFRGTHEGATPSAAGEFIDVRLAVHCRSVTRD